MNSGVVFQSFSQYFRVFISNKVMTKDINKEMALFAIFYFISRVVLEPFSLMNPIFDGNICKSLLFVKNEVYIESLTSRKTFWSLTLSSFLK